MVRGARELVKFYPYKKGEGEVLAMLKGGGGGHKFGVVFHGSLKF